VYRHAATLSGLRRLSPQVNGMPGHLQHHAATSRLCLLSSGSQVRVLPGAQVKEVLSTPDKPAEMQNGGAARHDLLGVTVLGDWVLSSKHGAPRRRSRHRPLRLPRRPVR
jgi:hypothetical protein